MKTYTVTRPEVHYSYVQVEASSPEDALKRVQDGEGEETSCEYSHTLDGEQLWDVKESA